MTMTKYCVVTEDITFDEVPEQQYPKIYSDALIICKVSGQPTPRVSWRYRNQKVQPGTSLYLFTQNNNNILLFQTLHTSSRSNFEYKNKQ